MLMKSRHGGIVSVMGVLSGFCARQRIMGAPEVSSVPSPRPPPLSPPPHSPSHTHLELYSPPTLNCNSSPSDVSFSGGGIIPGEEEEEEEEEEEGPAVLSTMRPSQEGLGLVTGPDLKAPAVQTKANRHTKANTANRLHVHLHVLHVASATGGGGLSIVLDESAAAGRGGGGQGSAPPATSRHKRAWASCRRCRRRGGGGATAPGTEPASQEGLQAVEMSATSDLRMDCGTAVHEQYMSSTLAVRGCMRHTPGARAV